MPGARASGSPEELGVQLLDLGLGILRPETDFGSGLRIEDSGV